MTRQPVLAVLATIVMAVSGRLLEPASTGMAVIHVSASSPRASDANPGTEDLALRTISAALKRAIDLNRRGVAARILVDSGVYRESIWLSADSQSTDAPIYLEGNGSERPIVSGADVWSDWTPHGQGSMYKHPWPHKWGLVPYPSNWEGSVTLEPIVRRREMVIADGRALQQVMSVREMKEGTFFVSEDEGAVYIWRSRGTPIATANIEVGIRSGLLILDGRKNVTVRRFVFRNDTSGVQGAAVRIIRSANVVFEDNVVVWNNWGGVHVFRTEGASLRRNVFNHNGGVGFGAFQAKGFISEDDEASFNNWRGASGGFLGWAVAGGKFVSVHNAVFRRVRSVGNSARGIWLDGDNIDVSVEASVLCGNRGDGVFFENIPGPVAMRDSIVCSNEGYGLIAGNAENVRVERNQIYGNRAGQIVVSGRSGGRVSLNWETRESVSTSPAKGFVLRENVIAGSRGDGLLFRTTLAGQDWRLFTATLDSDRNLWFSGETTRSFGLARGGVLTLDGWRGSTGQDRQSRYGEVRQLAPP